MTVRGPYQENPETMTVDEFDGQLITDYWETKELGWTPLLPHGCDGWYVWAHENPNSWEFARLPDGVTKEKALATMANSIGKEVRYNKSHDKAGKFSSGGIPDSTANELAAEARAPDGGFTYDVQAGKRVTRGFAVSPYPEHTKIVPAALLTGKDVQAYSKEKKPMLAKPGHKIGAWNDNGSVYLDVVIVAGSASSGAAIGKVHNQKAMYDLKNHKEIPLGGTGLASAADSEVRGYFNQVDRSVTKGAKACKECAANSDPKNVPVHPGCGCDIVTDTVALGMDPEEFAGVEAGFSDAVVQAIGDVPSALMQPELAVRCDASDFRFGDLTTWLVSLVDELDLICALFGGPEEIVMAAGRAVVIENTIKRDISSTSLSVVMFRRNASIEDIAKAYRIINEG